jgi:hypothetical protein
MVSDFEFLGLVVAATGIAVFLTYQIIRADAAVAKPRDLKAELRERDMQEQVRAANAPWWSAR